MTSKELDDIKSDLDDNTNISHKKINKSSNNLISSHFIRNPYVICVGMSNYGKYTKKLSNLLGVTCDIRNLKKLFENTYKYKHVHTVFRCHKSLKLTLISLIMIHFITLISISDHAVTVIWHASI